jgi:hypothetical protein
MKYVIPVGPNDYAISKLAIKSIRQNDTNSEIVIISNTATLCKFNNNDTININEDYLLNDVSYKTIKDFFYLNDVKSIRSGWFFQQFLKMGYSLICPDSYYIIWDADNLLLRKQDSTKPQKFLDFFVLRSNAAESYYYDFLEAFFPFMKGKVDRGRSYVTENMIIKTEIMVEIINEICASDPKPFPIIILEFLLNKNKDLF